MNSTFAPVEIAYRIPTMRSDGAWKRVIVRSEKDLEKKIAWLQARGAVIETRPAEVAQ